MTPIEELAALIARARWESLMSGVTRDDPEFLDKIQRDQAPICTTYFYSNLGRYGVQALDGEYGRSIRALKTVSDAIVLARKLETEPHLHAWIRYNLLHNIEIRFPELDP